MVNIKHSPRQSDIDDLRCRQGHKLAARARGLNALRSRGTINASNMSLHVMLSKTSTHIVVVVVMGSSLLLEVRPSELDVVVVL